MMRLATILAAALATAVLTGAPADALDYPPRSPHGGPWCATPEAFDAVEQGMTPLEVEDGLFGGYHGWRDSLVGPGHWQGRWTGKRQIWTFLQKAYRVCLPDGSLDPDQWTTVRYHRPVADPADPWLSRRVTTWPGETM